MTIARGDLVVIPDVENTFTLATVLHLPGDHVPDNGITRVVGEGTCIVQAGDKAPRWMLIASLRDSTEYVRARIAGDRPDPRYFKFKVEIDGKVHDCIGNSLTQLPDGSYSLGATVEPLGPRDLDEYP